MKIDIIIPTIKTKEEIDSQVKEIEDNTPEAHRIIATCQPVSASKNRNFGLGYANSDIIVMLDDDITGFYKGWLQHMIAPFKDSSIILSSARLLDANRNPNNNMGMGVSKEGNFVEIPPSFTIDGIRYRRVTTAAIAFRRNNVRCDEEFKLSAYEDTCFMNQLSKQFNDSKFVVNNTCKLIHLNNMCGQGDEQVWKFNNNHYCQKYPWDTVASKQKWWGKK